MIKRSKAFVLPEILITMMLQAGFILVLFTSFYMLTSFYTRTQQLLTARNHAERVISFFDDKIRHAGLGMWRCGSSTILKTTMQPLIGQASDNMPLYNSNFRLPVAVTYDIEGNLPDGKNLNDNPHSGGVLTLLYAQRDLSSGENSEVNLFISGSSYFAPSGTNRGTAILDFIDSTTGNGKNSNLFSTNSDFMRNQTNTSHNNIAKWAVMEGLGIPVYIAPNFPQITLTAYGFSSGHINIGDVYIPQAGELMYFKCMQMFAHGNINDEDGRQFAYRELKDDATDWEATYNQEKDILEIYMELDTTTKIFTLWVLASGGTDYTHDTNRPEAWPKEANPAGKGTTEAEREADAKKKWLASDYRHHVVYVSRASWKLNNLLNFTWN